MGKRFKFYPMESKIYDYLSMPGLIHFAKENEDRKNNYEEEVPKEYKELLSEMNAALKPHKEVISKYYYEEASLIFLLTSKYPFFYFSGVDAYLDHLAALEEEEILKSVVYALEIKAQDSLQSDEAMGVAEDLVKDQKQLLTYIQTLSYNAETKWHLLSFSNQPKKALQECIAMLKALKPIFEEYYAPKEELIKEYGEEFISRLNNLEGDALEIVSNGIIKNSAFPGEVGNMLISYFSGYSIHLNLGEFSYFAWGLELEGFFKKLEIIEGNEQTERILIFKNLGDKTRYEVLKCIAKGITSTKVIAEQLGVASATISYHISNLTTSKLIVPVHNEKGYGYLINQELLEKSLRELKKDLLL